MGNNVILDVNVMFMFSFIEIIWERRNMFIFLYSFIDMVYDWVEGGDILVFLLIIFDVEVFDKIYYRMWVINWDGIMISVLIYLDVNISMYCKNFF